MGSLPGLRSLLAATGEEGPKDSVLGCQTTEQLQTEDPSGGMWLELGKVRDEDTEPARHRQWDSEQRECETCVLASRSGPLMRGQTAQNSLAHLSGEKRRKRLISTGCLGSRGAILLLGAFFPHQIILGLVQGPVPEPWGDKHSPTRRPEASEGSAKGLSHSLSRNPGLAPVLSWEGQQGPMWGSMRTHLHCILLSLWAVSPIRRPWGCAANDDGLDSTQQPLT